MSNGSGGSGNHESGWHKLAVIGKITTPLLVVVLGWVVDRSLNRRDEAFSASLAQMTDQRIAAGQRIEQSELLVTLMPPLTGSDDLEKQLAMRIALHALGETGREIVEFVSESDTSEDNRRYAREQLDHRRRELIEQLIAPEHPTRWDAAEELGTTWASDPELVPDLIRFANANQAIQLAVFNATTVLADLPGSVLASQRSVLDAFLPDARLNGPATSAKVDTIQMLMGNRE